MLLLYKHFFTFVVIGERYKVKTTIRNIGNLFLFLAGIVFAIHIVVPHHHHNEQICLGGSFCHSDVFPHNHHSDSANHQHAGDTANNCILQQTFTLPVNHGKDDIGCDLDCPDNHSHDYTLILLFSNSEQPVPVITAVVSPPDFDSGWQDFIPTSSGLRAPPTV